MLPSIIEFLNTHLHDYDAVLTKEQIATIAEQRRKLQEQQKTALTQASQGNQSSQSKSSSSTEAKSLNNVDSFLDSIRIVPKSRAGGERQEFESQFNVDRVQALAAKAITPGSMPNSRESLLRLLLEQERRQEMVLSPLNDEFHGSTYTKARDDFAESIPFGAPLTHPTVQLARAAELERQASRLITSPAGGRAAQRQEQLLNYKAEPAMFNFFERPGGIPTGSSRFGQVDSNDNVLVYEGWGSKAGTITSVPKGGLDGINNFAAGSGATDLEFMRHISGRRSNFLTATMRTVSTVLLHQQLRPPPPLQKQMALPLDIGSLKKQLQREVTKMRKQHRHRSKNSEIAQQISSLTTASGAIDLSKFQSLKEALYVDLFQLGFVVERIVASRDLSHATMYWSAPCLYPPVDPLQEAAFSEPPDIYWGPASSHLSPAKLKELSKSLDDADEGEDAAQQETPEVGSAEAIQSMSAQEKHEKVVEAAAKVQDIIAKDPDSPAAMLIKHLLQTSAALAEMEKQGDRDEFLERSELEAQQAREAAKAKLEELKTSAPMSSAYTESPMNPAPNFRFTPGSYAPDPIDTPRPPPKPLGYSKLKAKSKHSLAKPSRLAAIDIVRSAVEAYLEIQIPRIRWALGKALNIRYVPTLSFVFDENKQRAQTSSRAVSRVVQQYTTKQDAGQLQQGDDDNSLSRVTQRKSPAAQYHEWLEKRKQQWRLQGRWSAKDELMARTKLQEVDDEEDLDKVIEDLRKGRS